MHISTRISHIVAATVAAAALATPVILAQQPAGPQKAPVFRTHTTLVRVDVIVRDKDGKVVKGLKDSDFIVYEDGKAQDITSFTFQEIATEPLPPLTGTD